jgi:hypothetical protein
MAEIKLTEGKINLLLTIGTTVLVCGVAYGAMNTSVVKQEERIGEVEKIVPIVAQQQVIIPEIQKGVDQIRVSQTTFVEKYDRNRESDQRFFQELLKEVKKA